MAARKRAHFQRSSVFALVGCLLSLIAGAAGTVLAQPAGEGPQAFVGRQLSDFRMRDAGGKMRELEDYAANKALVMVFVGTHCPMANAYVPVLNQLEQQYRGKGVAFLAVNSNLDEQGGKHAHAHAKAYKYGFPVLKDSRQDLARQVGARVTPEAFVFDGQQVLRYRGRIDNSYSGRLQKRTVTTSRDLQAAIEAVLAGKQVAQSVTPAFGCAIAYREEYAPKQEQAVAVGYYRDVAPIIQERCESCHRKDQVAPFTLSSYSDVRKWGKDIKEFVQSRQMPPWLAEPGHGDFDGSRRLPDSEIRTIAAWVDAGMPAGNRRDAPEPKRWPEGWMLGKPDLVLKMPEPHRVAATGEDEFRCFVLPTNLTEDKVVVGFEIRPGNSRVLHHVLNFVDTSGQARKLDEKDAGAGYSSGLGGIGFFPSGALCGWAPGNMPRFLPESTGWPLKKGSDVVIQVHYHKTGKEEVDQTTIGLYFAKEPVKYMARTWPLTSLLIDIPPGEKNHVVTASLRTPLDVRAFSITPHMHLLGKEMKVTATLPDGKVKDMVWVKNWDYRWQDTYRYKELVDLPKGTLLQMRAVFDNSSENPRNPSNPPARVRFGEQTTDEMAFAFLEFFVPSADGQAPGGGGLRRLLGGARE